MLLGKKYAIMKKIYYITSIILALLSLAIIIYAGGAQTTYQKEFACGNLNLTCDYDAVCELDEVPYHCDDCKGRGTYALRGIGVKYTSNTSDYVHGLIAKTAWNLSEETQGVYDFSLLNMTIDGAKDNNKK